MRSKRKTNEEDVITRKELLYSIETFKGYKPLRDRALIAFLYITGARISEVVRRITPNQITKELFNDKEFIIIHNVECLKRRNNKAKRNIPISMERDIDFLRYIIPYVDSKNDPDKPLFSMNRQHAYKIVRKFNDKWCHYFRHLRCSHLATMGWNAAEIQHFIGWVNTTPTSTYVHLNWQDLARRM